MHGTLSLPRSQWVSALSTIEAKELAAQVQELAIDWQIHPKINPQSGLGVLKIKESTVSESFFLGEFPLCTVWVEIITPENQTVEGAANYMGDDLEFAHNLALCDAILANELNGWQTISKLLDLGAQCLKQKEQERKHILASTKVDFSLLEEADEKEKQQSLNERAEPYATS